MGTVTEIEAVSRGAHRAYSRQTCQEKTQAVSSLSQIFLKLGYEAALTEPEHGTAIHQQYKSLCVVKADTRQWAVP